MEFSEIINKHYQSAVELRRELHRFPELSREEKETTRRIRDFLVSKGFSTEEVELNGAKVQVSQPLETGLVVRIKRGEGGPVVAFRADIDALPVHEETGLSFASENPGRMHACGHDGHTAVLALTLLSFVEDTSWEGEVRGIFQPAEELYGGAERMVAAGALDGADYVYALHIWPEVPEGIVASRPGTIMASNDRFSVVLKGKSGHGAAPHLAKDPIVCACSLVTSLQSIVSREIAPWDGAVLTIGSISAGTAYNIIPDKVTLEGTIRALSQESRKKIGESLKRHAEYTAKAFGLEAEVEHVEQYPPTVNHQTALEIVQANLPQGLTYKELSFPSMAAEDFSFYTEKVTGAMLFLGSRTEECSMPLHNSKFKFNEKIIGYGAELFLSVGRSLLKSR